MEDGQKQNLPWFTPGRVALVVGLLAFIVYLATLAPSFGFVDKGEMAAVAATLGIAHPTGYPTLMLLGYLFTSILPLRDIVALNVMAALLTAAGAGVLTLLLFDLMSRLIEPEPGSSKKRKKKKKKSVATTEVVSPHLCASCAGLAALAVALTSTWWSQGTSFEVYSLHVLMMPLLTWLFLRYLEEQEARPVGFSRRGALFGLVLGLSFTNHMTTILFAPALLLVFFWTLGIHRKSLGRLLWLVPGFLVGLLPYVWLPVRASMKPMFNWGNPSTLKQFFDHVTGRQYRVWMFTNPETFHQQTSYFLSRVPSEVAYIGLLLAVAGIFEMARRNAKLALWSLATLAFSLAYLLYAAREYGIIPYALIGLAATAVAVRLASVARLSVATTLLFITCVGYAGGYDIMEIRPYYFAAVFAIGLWIGMGFLWLHRTFGVRSTLAAAALLVVMTGLLNFADSNERGNTLVEDMTVNMLESLPRDALVLSALWDFWVSGSFYMQAVEGLRPDVLVIDPELLRRSWYLDQLHTTYPDFMAQFEEEEAQFREHLYKFEHKLPYDSVAIDSTYKGLIQAMIDKSIDERPVFVTGDVNPTFGASYARIPYYLALRLMRDDTYLPQDFPEYRYRSIERSCSVYTTKLAELYASSTYARGLYELQHGAQAAAERYFELAMGFDPRCRPEDIPPQPLDGNERIAATIRWFQQLRQAR
jgi:hypothetical protein